MRRFRFATLLLSIVVAAGAFAWRYGRWGAASPVTEIEVPPTRFVNVMRQGDEDWEPFVEPSTGCTGHRLVRQQHRNVTVRMHDLNDTSPTTDEYDVAPGGYVVTGHQRIRIHPGAT